MGSLRSLSVLMVAAFVDTLGSFLVLALLPFYAERFGASAVEVGVLMSGFALAQSLSAPYWGRASDRWGRRPVLLFGLALSAFAYIVFAFADSLWLLMASRLAQGVGGGTISVIFAYVSDAVAPERRAQAIGWVTSATSLAAMIGPPLGSVSARLSPAAPGLVTAGICGLALLFASWRLREPGAPPAAGAERPALRPRLLAVIRHPRRPLSALIWFYATGMLAFSALTGIVALYLERRFQVTEETIWLFLTYVAALSVAVRVAVLGPLVRRFGEAAVLRAGALALGAGLVALPLPDSVPGLAVATFFVPLGTSLLFPCTTALISRHAPSPHEVGVTLGVQQAFGGASRILGPLLAGVAFQYLSIGSPFGLAGATLLGLVAVTATLELGVAAGSRMPESPEPTGRPHRAASPATPGSADGRHE